MKQNVNNLKLFVGIQLGVGFPTSQLPFWCKVFPFFRLCVWLSIWTWFCIYQSTNMKYNLLAVFPVGFSWSIGTVGYLSADTVPTDCLSGTKHSSKHDSEQSPIHQPVSHFSVSLSPHLEGGEEKTLNTNCMSATKQTLNIVVFLRTMNICHHWTWRCV